MVAILDIGSATTHYIPDDSELESIEGLINSPKERITGNWITLTDDEKTIYEKCEVVIDHMIKFGNFTVRKDEKNWSKN